MFGSISNSFEKYAQGFMGALLQQGPMPKHIGVIMDGNRRYARRQGYPTALDGHIKGKENMKRLLASAEFLAVSELTVYCFSIENFKRAEEEVKGLMDLFTEAGTLIHENIHQFNDKGVGIEVLGNYKMAPTPTLKYLIAKTMWLTKGNFRYKLNIAFAYTSQNEITKGLNSLLEGLVKNEIWACDLSEELLQEIFTLTKSNPVDILIRTGGDQRLSDFLLWQSGNAYVEFVKDTWPEFTYWHFVGIIFRYQMQQLWTKDRKLDQIDSDSIKFQSSDGYHRKHVFLKKHKTAVWNELKLVSGIFQ